VRGIHATLFYGFSEKKKYYPTKREAEMVETQWAYRIEATIVAAQKQASS